MNYKLLRLLPVALFAVLLIMAQSGCYYDKESELYPISTNCDTTNVTYSLVVQPILSTQCYTCHSNSSAAASGQGISLEDSATLKTYALNGKLVCDLNNGGGSCHLMPLGGTKLDQCTINKIAVWANAGAPITGTGHVPCDTTQIDYTNYIQPILNSQCYSCHSNANAAASGQNISLEDSATLKTYALNGRLVCDMKHGSGCNAMPITTTTDTCSIHKISAWVNAGASIPVQPHNNTCDTTSVKYSTIVQPILSAQCYSCHSNGAAASYSGGTAISLEDFPTLTIYAQNGKLICDMNHGNGCHAMPLTGNPVDACSISKIAAWVNAGAPNN